MARPPKLRDPTLTLPLPGALESEVSPALAKVLVPAPHPALAGLPKMLEFRPHGRADLWRVERFEELAVEFDLLGESPPECRARLTDFAHFASQYDRLWLLVRRLYGVAPVIPGPEATMDDLRVWSYAELVAGGWDVKVDLEALRVFWQSRQANLQRSAAPAAAPAAPAPAAAEEFPQDGDVLARFQFSPRLFSLTVFDPLGGDGRGADVVRAERENVAERTWFTGRVSAWSRMLGDAMGGPIARTALLNDLYLRRLETEIALATTPKARAVLYEQKSTLAREYDQAIQRLQEMFPEMAVAGKVSFRALLSDVVVGNWDYKAYGDHRLVDKIHTATELDFLTTRSRQVGPRYNLGLYLAILEAINGLTDPDFRSQLKPRTLARMTAVATAALEAGRELTDEPMVDLEDGVLPGEGTDFEDFTDAECPHCGAPISSRARRCAECRKSVVAPPAPLPEP